MIVFLQLILTNINCYSNDIKNVFTFVEQPICANFFLTYSKIATDVSHKIAEISSASMMSDSSIPAEHAEHQINVNSSCSLRTVAEQSINIDSYVANASMDEEQSSIAN